jgi:hypothetical protein
MAQIEHGQTGPKLLGQFDHGAFSAKRPPQSYFMTGEITYHLPPRPSVSGFISLCGYEETKTSRSYHARKPRGTLGSFLVPVILFGFVACIWWLYFKMEI